MRRSLHLPNPDDADKDVLQGSDSYLPLAPVGHRQICLVESPQLDDMNLKKHCEGPIQYYLDVWVQKETTPQIDLGESFSFEV